jgi:hypothetical protein
MVNGEDNSYFKPGKGLRQGYPLVRQPHGHMGHRPVMVSYRFD